MTKNELKKLVDIAQENIPAMEGRADLEAQGLDDLDFLDVSVWCLKDALVAAYELGKAAGRKEVNN